MKKLFTLFCFFVFFGSSIAQTAGDYFPSNVGFEWKYKVTPLDSASNPVDFLTLFRIDSYAADGNYQGKFAHIVKTKTGPLQTILSQPFTDSLFFNTDGTDGCEYLNTKKIEGLLIILDQTGVISDFSFVDFFGSLRNWYSTYKFVSDVNMEYTLLQKDTTISIDPIELPLQFKYLGMRLQDQTIQTVLGNFDCKKFLLQWKIASTILGDLLTLNDTIWIAPSNWVVQDIMPGQYVDNLTFLGIQKFAIPGLETKLTDEIVTVANEESIPITFYLEQNYPNPFNPSTTIKYSIPELSFITLKVYDVLGNEIATLVNEEKQIGNYEVEFNGNELTSGIYFYQLQAGEFVKTKKMILLK